MPLMRRLFDRRDLDPAELICPVCGYYCLGRGGAGCIDKLAAYDRAKAQEKVGRSVEAKA